MRVIHLIALALPLAACAPSAGTVLTKAAPTPFGQPCATPCTVRIVNQTALPLTVLAESADGTRIVGKVAPRDESAFSESMLSPSYLASPDASSGDAAVTCTPQAPRAGETILLVCK